MKLWERLKTSSKWQTVVVAVVWMLFKGVAIGTEAAPGMFSADQHQSVFLALLAGVGAQGLADFGKDKT